MMKDLQSLLPEIERTWLGPAPVVLTGWADQHEECRSTFDAFAGKDWSSLESDTLPRSFTELAIMIELCPESAGYYVAAYIRSYISGRDYDLLTLVDTIEFFLNESIADPIRFGFSPDRCRVINSFLQATNGEIWWQFFPEIVEQWREFVERLEPE